MKEEYEEETTLELRRDDDVDDEVFVKREKGNVCFECRLDINDRFLLKVGVSNYWHANCLRCSECLIKLQNFSTCYFRDQHVFCRRCYRSHYSRICSACSRSIGPTDWVRHAKGFVYHLACFSCHHCKRQLSTGEEFALTGHKIRCRTHFQSSSHGSENDGEQTSSIDDDSNTSSDDTMTSSDNSPKPKRIRTTFSEKQLEVLHAHFKVDVNPDSSCLHTIAQVTGLSKRVTQVWFQNSRARQKKYTTHSKTHAYSGKHYVNYQTHIKMEV